MAVEGDDSGDDDDDDGMPSISPTTLAIRRLTLAATLSALVGLEASHVFHIHAYIRTHIHTCMCAEDRAALWL